MKQTTKRKVLIGALGAVIAVASASPVLAHRGRRPHRHYPAIVISKPRPVRTVVLVSGKPAAVVDFNVSPEKTRIYVDGTYRGLCDDFDGFPRKMYLKPGKHTIRLVSPSGTVVVERVELAAGFEVNLNLDIE
jgi:hypothetical protein